MNVPVTVVHPSPLTVVLPIHVKLGSVTNRNCAVPGVANLTSIENTYSTPASNMPVGS